MAMVVNPGSGPVGDGANEPDARAAMQAFVRDLELGTGVWFHGAGTDDGNGRFRFEVGFTKEGEPVRKIEVDMPGLPIEQVRYLDQDGQNIWDFPRLYVNGSSWVWLYATHIARSDLLGED